jgi:hypothetical protein
MTGANFDRRRFLVGFGSGICAGIAAPRAARGADKSAGQSCPLFHWTSAQAVRNQPEEVWRLVDLINAFRKEQGLPEAPLSPRLTAVALAHVNDLVHNRPHAANGNLHSWSRGEHWSGGEYRADDKSTCPVMWDKPREIAGYEGHGFEIAASHVESPAEALSAWRSSPVHLDVILSRGVWSKPRWRWKAMGAVCRHGYACAWFGADEDKS